MKNHSHYMLALISGVLFTIIAVGHLVRIIFGWTMNIGENGIPMWVSIVAAIIAGGMGVWNFSNLKCCKTEQSQT